MRAATGMSPPPFAPASTTSAYTDASCDAVIKSGSTTLVILRLRVLDGLVTCCQYVLIASERRADNLNWFKDFRRGGEGGYVSVYSQRLYTDTFWLYTDTFQCTEKGMSPPPLHQRPTPAHTRTHPATPSSSQVTSLKLMTHRSSRSRAST